MRRKRGGGLPQVQRKVTFPLSMPKKVSFTQQIDRKGVLEEEEERRENSRGRRRARKNRKSPSKAQKTPSEKTLRIEGEPCVCGTRSPAFSPVIYPCKLHFDVEIEKCFLSRLLGKCIFALYAAERTFSADYTQRKEIFAALAPFQYHTHCVWYLHMHAEN